MILKQQVSILSNKIIEYCFMNLDEKYIQHLINPGFAIADTITKITTITNDMLKEQPPIIEKKKKEILEFLNLYQTECTYIVAHNNCNFDRFFFKKIFKDDTLWNPILNKKVKYIDTIHLAKYLLPNNKQYSLGALCKYFNIIAGTHRATAIHLHLKNYLKNSLLFYHKKKILIIIH